MNNDIKDRHHLILRENRNVKINEAMVTFWHTYFQRDVALTGRIIKAQAFKYAEQFGIRDFRASNGWLDSFKHRLGITYRSVGGGSKNVFDLSRNVEREEEIIKEEITETEETIEVVIKIEAEEAI